MIATSRESEQALSRTQKLSRKTSARQATVRATTAGAKGAGNVECPLSGPITFVSDRISARVTCSTR